MSDLMGQDAPAPDAKTVGEQAADWIQRRQFWAWTEHEQAMFDTWLAESLAHHIAYTRAEVAWNRTERLSALRSSEPAEHTSKGSWLSRTWVRTAAAIVFVAAAIGAEQYFKTSPETTYATSIGEHKTVRLVDGSQIELNTSTILKTSQTTDRRLVKLVKGEAFFIVNHDSAHPLVVIAGNHRITDLGTKFLMRSEPNWLEVVLVEGRAAFGSADGRTESPIVLIPGDALVVSDNQIRTTRKSTQMLASELGWRHGMLVFENASLGEAADEINRYNARKIVVADRATARMKISAAFPTTGIEDFVQLAHQLLGLKVDHRDEEIIISR